MFRMRKILLDKKYIFIALVVLAAILVPLGALSAEQNLSCLGWFYINIPGCVGVLGNLLLFLVSRILWLTAKLFEGTLKLTLNNGTFTNITVIDLGWSIVRDVVNLFFIFILLYIAIGAILRLAGHDAKKLLVNLILAALLINFSLVITKVIIDASNILALEFYTKIGKDKDGKDIGVTTTLMNGLHLSSIYSGEILEPDTKIEETKVEKKETDKEINIKSDIIKTEAADLEQATILKVILGTLGGSILILVTAFVFLAATFLFIARTIVLWFLMILSPLAFMAMVLPQTKKYADRWWQELTCQCLLAPAFMFMIYLVVMIIKNGSFSSVLSGVDADAPTSLAAAFKDYTDKGVGVILNFVLLTGLMIGSLIVSKNLACAGGAQAMAAAAWTKGKVQGYAKSYGKRGAGAAAEWSMKKEKEIEEKGGFWGKTMKFTRKYTPGMDRGLAALSGAREKELAAKRKQYEKQYKGYSDVGLETMLKTPIITSEKRKVIKKIQDERLAKKEIEDKEKADYKDIVGGEETIKDPTTNESKKIIKPGKLKEINSELNNIMEKTGQDIDTYLDGIEVELKNLERIDSGRASTRREELIHQQRKISRLTEEKEKLETIKEKLEEKWQSEAKTKKLEEMLGKIENKEEKKPA